MFSIFWSELGNRRQRSCHSSKNHAPLSFLSSPLESLQRASDADGWTTLSIKWKPAVRPFMAWRLLQVYVCHLQSLRHGLSQLHHCSHQRDKLGSVCLCGFLVTGLRIPPTPCSSVDLTIRIKLRSRKMICISLLGLPYTCILLNPKQVWMMSLAQNHTPGATKRIAFLAIKHWPRKAAGWVSSEPTILDFSFTSHESGLRSSLRFTQSRSMC